MSSCHNVLKICRCLLRAQQISDEASPAVLIHTEPEYLVSTPSVTAARLQHQPKALIWTSSRSVHFVFQTFFSFPPGSSLRKFCQDNRKSDEFPVFTLTTYKTNWHDRHGPKTGTRTLICEDMRNSGCSLSNSHTTLHNLLNLINQKLTGLRNEVFLRTNQPRLHL